MLSVLNNKYLFWTLLAIPAIPLLKDFIYDERYYAELMYESGFWSSLFLVISLAITPLRLLLKKYGPMKNLPRVFSWLIIRRRYLGVAAFAYALIHTAFYIRKIADLESILLDVKHIDLLLGWIALIIFLILAVTSNNYSVKVLGKRWKTLHRWVYLSAILTFTHWLMFDFFYKTIFVLFIPLLLIQIYRILINKKFGEQFT